MRLMDLIALLLLIGSVAVYAGDGWETSARIRSTAAAYAAQQSPAGSDVSAGMLDERLRLPLCETPLQAQPTGGMGISRQLKNELKECPPIILVLRRADDRWLATWSQADAVLVHPLDPLAAAETVADVLRRTQRAPVVAG